MRESPAEDTDWRTKVNESKNPIQQWLDTVTSLSNKVMAAIGAVAAVLGVAALLFPMFLSPRTKLAIAVILVVLVLIGSSLLTLYRSISGKRRAAWAASASIPEPIDTRAALRFLLPFEDGDELPGRGPEIQMLCTLVTSGDFRFGTLYGESGCGKTSLIRAGLLPQLRAQGFLPIYVERATKDPKEMMTRALPLSPDGSGKDAPDLHAALSEVARHESKPLVVIVDQFEEFFVGNSSARARGQFLRQVGACVQDVNLRVRFLFGIRSDMFVRMYDFATHGVAEPGSTRAKQELENFDSVLARRVLIDAAKHDGISFDPGLIDAIISDLTNDDGFIRPAPLQIVATRLKGKRIANVDGYEIAGRASGLLSSYISEEITTSADPKLAKLVLRMFCSDEVDSRLPDDLSIDAVVAATRDTSVTEKEHQARIRSILDQFSRARILLQTADEKYNLVHDYLTSYVRKATEGVETRAESANRLLRRYIALYREDPRTRIPLYTLRLIGRHASPDLTRTELVRALFRKSRKTFLLRSGLLTSVLALTFVLALTAGTSYYGWGETSLTVPTGGREIRQSSFAPHGREMAVVYRDCVKNPIEIWAIAGNRVNVTALAPVPPRAQFSCGVRAGRTALAYSPDGSLLAITDDCGLIYLWDVKTTMYHGALDFYAPNGCELVKEASIGFSGDMRLISAIQFANGRLRLDQWDLTSGKPLPLRPLPSWIAKLPSTNVWQIASVAFGPNNEAWAIIEDGQKKTYQLWDLDAGVMAAPIQFWDPASDPVPQPSQCAEHPAWNQARQAIMITTSDDRVWLWEYGTGRAVTSFKAHSVCWGSMSADGELLAVGFQKNAWFYGKGRWVWGKRTPFPL
jgi:hypothetical protein